MALAADNIRVAGNTRIYLAPLDTAFPAWDAEPTGAWVDLGYVTEDGITFSFGREINEIFAMQSADPVRVVSTRTPKSVGFSMMQQGREQYILAMGGGTWGVEGEETDVYRFEPPPSSEVDERAMLLEMVDGANRYRWHYKRTQNREGIEHTYTKDGAAVFSVTMAVLTPADGSVPYYLTSDDPAFAAA